MFSFNLNRNQTLIFKIKYHWILGFGFPSTEYSRLRDSSLFNEPGFLGILINLGFSENFWKIKYELKVFWWKTYYLEAIVPC